MKEKYVELQNCLEKGNLIAMALLAILLSETYTMIEINFHFIIELFIASILFIFMVAGVVYGLKQSKFKFTLNPIKLIINIYILYIKLIFFGLLFPFFYFKTLIKYSFEIIKEKRQQKKMCI